MIEGYINYTVYMIYSIRDWNSEKNPEIDSAGGR